MKSAAHPIAVITADTHLARRTWVKYPDLEGDSYYGLDQITEFCCEHHLPLFLAGDVFDKTRPDPITIAHTNRCLSILEYEEVPVYYIQGQHELDRVQPWLSAISKWPEHIHKNLISLLCPDGSVVRIYGLDWTPADIVKAELDKIPRNADVLLAHQVWLDLMGPRLGESECAFGDVPHVSMIATGDFHRHQVLSVLNRDGSPTTILSPGPLCMQSIDEDPLKRFFVLNADMSISVHKVKTRQCLRFTINTKEDLDIFLSGNVEPAVVPQPDVPQHIAKNILHITYQDDVPEVYTRITSAVGGRAHLFIVPVRHQTETITIETARRRVLADGGLEACLELAVDPSLPLYRDLLVLLRSLDKKLQLEAMQETFKGRVANDRQTFQSTETQ